MGIIKGKFAVSLKLDEGLVIDRSTGRVKNSKAPKTIEWLMKRLKSRFRPIWFKKHWDFESRDGLFLTSKKTYSFLELTTYQKGFILSYIPTNLQPLIVGDEMTEKCFTAYQYGRIAGTMTPERERIFHQCFGPKKQAILQHEGAQRALCQKRTSQFRTIAIQQIRLLRSFEARRAELAEATRQHDEFKENGLYDLIAELSLDVASVGLARGLKKVKFTGTADAVDPAVASIQYELFSNKDAVDTLILAASISAFAILGGTTAPLITALVTLGSVSKSIYDFVEKSDEADGNLMKAAKDLDETLQRLAENTQTIVDFWQAAEAEGCAWLLADIRNDVGISVPKLVANGRATQN
ncbi:MAG: hypothetical protein JJ850_10330 [Kordiimonadaceae bacterium]|nr:hypothetical protein [Kordiimonadaceae bacterium]MBO6569531.1 hypothetical protein [Kordiimonadaceae bacterium]MBO6965006.1 hypothetical protein [Kordiimonadaceae bacterium]